MKITTAEWAPDQCRVLHPLVSQYNQALHSSSVFKVDRWKLRRVPCQSLFGHSRSPSIQPFQWGLLHKHHRPMHKGKQYHEGKENTIHHRCSGILKNWIAKQIVYRWHQLTHHADPLLDPLFIKSEKLRDSNYTCIDTHTHLHTHSPSSRT